MESIHRLYPKEPRIVLLINHQNLHSKFIVREYYCANPECKCNEGVFPVIQNNFFGLPKRIVTQIRYTWKKPLSLNNPLLDHDYEYPEYIDQEESLICIGDFRRQLLENETLIPRLKKHYQMVKSYGITGNCIYTEQQDMIVNSKQPKIGRNDPCLCGSGKKYKKCCLQ